MTERGSLEHFGPRLDPAVVGRPLPFLERIESRREKESIPRFNKFVQGYYDASGVIKESFDSVIENDRLYGRGGGDDGYAAFASLTAIRALQEQGIPHGRCVMLIEACEESGSYDLPHYVEHLSELLDRVLGAVVDHGVGVRQTNDSVLDQFTQHLKVANLTGEVPRIHATNICAGLLTCVSIDLAAVFVAMAW